MTFPNLLIKEVKEEFAQENFKRIQDFYRQEPLNKFGFKFLDLQLGLGANIVPHFLNYVPLDVIMTHNSTNATVTFNYLAFTRDTLSITSSASTRIRILIGRLA